MSLQSDILQEVQSALLRLRDDVRQSMSDKGVNASGRTSASLDVRINGDSVEMGAFGTDHAPVQTLEVGRGAGNVPAKFTDILVQWSIDKGLSFDTDRERRSFAYLLGRRIAEKGTLRHVSNIDVYSDLTVKAAEELNNRLANLVKVNISNAVRDLR